MRLGYKSKILLEMIASAGADIAQFCIFPTSSLMKAGGWSEERSMTRHLKTMENEGWIVWDDSRESGKWSLKVTASGRKTLTSDFDPAKAWSREWDEQWRIIGFDLPERQQDMRRELISWLKTQRFGCLQHSLWVTPCFDDSWHADLAKLKFNPAAVSFIEGRSFSRSSNADFVRRAWNFDEINRLYRELLSLHAKSSRPEPGSSEFSSWIQSETTLWQNAFERDPFLPKPLLPKGYLGEKAVATRGKTYASFLAK